MKLLVVILNYRVTDLTINCLHSLAPRISAVPGTRVALLENGTGGDAEARIRRAIDENGWSRWLDFAVVHPNLGFTGGNNHLIRPALASADPPEYVLLLNADTLVSDNSLPPLVDFMDRNPRVGIAGSKLIWEDGVAQGSPFRFMGIRTELQSGMRLVLLSKLLRSPICITPKPQTAAKVDWVAGASMILRRTMLEAIGLLDEGLYTYYDDIDICLRAKRAGWETWYVPASEVVHLEGRSTGIVASVVKRRPAYWFDARRRFLLKSYGAFYTALVDAAFLSGFACWRLRRWLQRRPDTDPPHFLGDSFRHSVFGAGFKVPVVENPAMPKVAQP